jgi:NhaP-type Na+/H+ or K+/H+ antiporter
MTLDLLLAVTGCLGLGVAAMSSRLRRLPVTEPVFALLAGVLVGPAVLGWLDLPTLVEQHHALHEGTRVLLAISVMGVALRYPFREARSRAKPVALLLLVAMPLMALVSAGLATAILGFSLAAALLLGTAICPTDPVLASSVVTGRPAEDDVPVRERQVLSLESGANDGLALPLVIIALGVAGATSAFSAAATAVWEVLGAVALGALLGWFGARALRAGETHRAAGHGPMLLFAVVLALTTLGLSGLVHVDGVLAVFVAGLAFNASVGQERAEEAMVDEALNRFAVLPLFAYLGAVLPWAEWSHLGWPVLGLALAVLLLRRLPVLLLLRRPLRLGWAEAVYLGWFGPIGVSALFYLTLEAKQMQLPHSVLAAGALVVVLSTLVHGLTAAPGRVLYRRAVGEGGRVGQRA